MAIVRPPAKPRVGKSSIDESFYNYYANFTDSALTDELTRILSEKLDCDICEDGNGQCYLSIFRPYINQAEGLLYRINICEYPPPFVIWKKDIPDTLVEVLQELGKVATKRIMTEVVRRLYESVDSNYFHINGLYNRIPWAFGKSTKK